MTSFSIEMVVDPTRQCEDGIPVRPGALKLEYVGRLAWFGPTATEVAQCTPLGTWWDGSVRLLHVIAPKGLDEKTLILGSSSRAIDPPPVADPLPGVRKALADLVVMCDVYTWRPTRIERTAFAGPYRWDFDASGWLVDEDGARHTWGRAWVSYRPHVAPRSLEVVFVHANMQPHGAKLGTLEVDDFAIEANGDPSKRDVRFRPGSPRAFENYPMWSSEQVAPMRDLFLPDGAAQVVHLIIDSGPAQPDLYGPMRPAHPESVYGYGDFDGVLPPTADVENALVDLDMLKQIVPSAAASQWEVPDTDPHAWDTVSAMEQTNDANPLRISDPRKGPDDGRDVERVVARWDHAVYPGESGYRHMGDQLDFPQLVGGNEEHYWRMMLTANDRLEDPGQRAHPSDDGKAWLEWRHPMDGDRYETGPVNQRANGPDAEALKTAPDLRTFASGRGTWARGSSSCQHNVVGAERQAWIRTGKGLYRELIVEKALMLKTIPGFKGGIPFSGRAAGSCLGMALAADEADQVVERTALGWEVRTPSEPWWYTVEKQVTSALQNAGRYRANGEWTSLPEPGSKDVVNLGLGSGGSAWESIYCPWMSAWWIQNVVRFAVLERVRRSMRPAPPWNTVEIGTLARRLVATLRFQQEKAKTGQGYAYKLQILADTDGSGHPPYVPCDDGGKPTGAKYFWNSSSVWNAAGLGALLFWFRDFVPDDLRAAALADLRQLVDAHDRDNKGRKRWILPLASARRVLEREGV